MGRSRSAGVALAALAALALVSSCTVEPVVTNITVTPTSFTLDAVGATQQLTANVTAQDGRPVPGATVTWTSSNAPAATVDASGLVTAVANGPAQITASANGANGSASVIVAQQVDNLAKTGGDGQSGQVGNALATALEVRADDRLGNPVAGVNVVFSVSAGGGSVATGLVTTPATGRASTTWTVGRVSGAAQSAAAGAQGKTATFSATATAGPADSLVKVSGDNQTAPAGTALPESLVVRVADRFGNAVAGHAVTFSVASGGGSVSPTTATTGTNGRAATRFTLGNGAGTQTAQATASGVTVGSPAVFTATALVGTVAVFDGNGQTGLVGFGVNVAPAVRVVNQSNQPLAGLAVTFAETGGGGSVTGASQLTGSDGVARVGKWTLGLSAGSNTMTATVTGSGFAGSPAQFTATGVTPTFNIELRNLTTLTTAQQQAFDNAKSRWQQLVFGDLPNVALNAAAGQCGSNSPAVNETIDDLVIFVTAEMIDGPGGTLGSAGPCFIRSLGNLPVLGRMRLDTDDLASLESTGQLQDVILHEMGHVLGFGTLWSTFGFLQNPSLPDPPGEDTYFNGPKAIAAFDAMGGTSYTGGAKVPVENTEGGEGTRDSHWRESVFDHELMTGFIEVAGTANPLSRLSVASLWDMGYMVNLDGSDAYTRVFTGPALAARRDAGQLLLNDIARGPIYVVDAGGRVVRVVQF